MKKRMRREIAFVSRSPLKLLKFADLHSRARITPSRFHRPISCQLTLQRYRLPLQFGEYRDTTTRGEEIGACVHRKPQDKDQERRRKQGCGGKEPRVGSKKKEGGMRKDEKRDVAGTKELRTGGLHTRAQRNVRAHAS